MAEVGTGANHPGEGEGALVGEALVAAALAFGGDPEEVGADAELAIGGDVVPGELVVDVGDTAHQGDVEVGGGAVVGVVVFVAPSAGDGVP